LLDSGYPASRCLAQLGSLLALAPVASLLFCGTPLALAVASWRGRRGRAVGQALTALGQCEALCALAAYAFENPSDPFPEIVLERPCFDAEELGHPLLPRARCVRNDVRLDGQPRVLIVSGSNMSGKSTFLRTVGINTVLARMGAPVRARRLRIAPLVVGATLRVQDSLQAGRSRFFAEVLRVRQLLDLARQSPPLLFLLDELFQGTNSEDRRVGAEAVLRLLLDSGAIGMVTTHDLALTAIAERMGPLAANVHFEDRYEDDAMVFDYRLRSGIVQSSNGLALLRAVGITV
jgi:DNA mismatch repair ATPase MutS